MLVTLNHLTEDARKGNYGIGAFNVVNLEALMAVVAAAEEEQVPVILQHAQNHECYIDMETIGPVMLDFARKASVPVCVHFDHGNDFESCMKAIKMGFTSVMYDGSGASLERNIMETVDVVRAAHAVGVSVEGELGVMLNSEDGGCDGREAVSRDDFKSEDDFYTNPGQAGIFVKETGVDALAISFGNVHGVYTQEPILNIDHIAKIRNKIDVPFVVHGGSGISDGDYRAAIKNGVRKINYFTYMMLAGGQAVRDYLANEEHPAFQYIALAGMEGMKENARHAMRVFAKKG